MVHRASKRSTAACALRGHTCCTMHGSSFPGTRYHALEGVQHHGSAKMMTPTTRRMPRMPTTQRTPTTRRMPTMPTTQRTPTMLTTCVSSSPHDPSCFCAPSSCPCATSQPATLPVSWSVLYAPSRSPRVHGFGAWMTNSDPNGLSTRVEVRRRMVIRLTIYNEKKNGALGGVTGTSSVL